MKLLIMFIAEGVLGIAGLYITFRIALRVAEGFNKVNDILILLGG